MTSAGLAPTAPATSAIRVSLEAALGDQLRRRDQHLVTAYVGATASRDDVVTALAASWVLPGSVSRYRTSVLD